MREFLTGPRSSVDDQGPLGRIAAVTARFRQAHDEPPESWSAATWQEFTLRLLWETCLAGVGMRRPRVKVVKKSRARDVLCDAAGVDADDLVHELLIPFCAAFLDQGVAAWTLPHREQGFFRAFASLYGAHRATLPRWLHGLQDELSRLQRVDATPLDSIRHSLAALGVAPRDREEYIVATLFALRGWAGMMWQMETNAEWAVHPAPADSLIEFLAVRLILDRLAAAHIARETLGFHGPLSDLHTAVGAPSLALARNDESLPLAFLMFQLAQALGWSPEDIYRQPPAAWRRLLQEIESFSSLERRRILQFAYERRYRIQTLDALAVHQRQTDPAGRHSTLGRPAFQVVCCLDEREESFRRHLEELAPEAETLGAAGFFGVAMYYRGIAEAYSRPLCPVVVKPQHYVNELPAYTLEDEHQRRARTRRLLGAASHQIHRGSRSLLGGALTALLGSMASIPLVARILFPRAAAQIRRHAGRLLAAPQLTQLQLERCAPEPGPEPGHIGFSLDEMAGIVERMLRDLGLTKRLAPIVLFFGHGSSSMNNPHGSAYNCGACGGGRGGPNARAFAQMANDPRIRAKLAQRGLALPDDVVLVGGYHNTCDDSVSYFDLDKLPPSHRECFDRMRKTIDEARRRNALERCRRFESAPLSLDADAALRHVEARSEDLAQVRPECGHATNSVCIVGRRERTRGLFLDRRSFLTSYDPTQDDADSTILARVLQAVIPVCAGINLEYYFSFVDSGGWGCGTKLPHNITSLLGVMDGAASDLRPGLPWQMVEIHEPMRILFVIETTPAAMEQLLDRNPPLAALCRNDWVQLATLDPESQRIDVLHRGAFKRYRPETNDLPEAASSSEWFRGWRDHLGYASITPGDIAQPRA
jgi:uncharacterized protein YbcC (UPF0753/DUF2309 family)